MLSQDLRSSLTLMQKAAVITSLKWIGQWLNDMQSCEPSNRLIETAKLIGFDLSDPVLSAFEEDDNQLGNQLKELNEYQKIWFITELHLAATENGPIPPNVAQVVLMICESMKVSSDLYIEIIQLAGDLSNLQ